MSDTPDSRDLIEPTIAAPTITDLPSDRHAALRAHLVSEIRLARTDRAPARTPVMRRRFGYAALGTVAAGLLVATTIASVDFDDKPTSERTLTRPATPDLSALGHATSIVEVQPASSERTPAVIDRISLAAGARQATPRGDRFAYVLTEGFVQAHNRDGSRNNAPFRTQIWSAIDGSKPDTGWHWSQDRDAVTGETRTSSNELGKNYWQAGPGHTGRDGEVSVGTSYSYLAELPTDPDALLARFRGEYDPAKDGFFKSRDRYVTWLLMGAAESGMAPPAQTAAIFRAWSKIAGVKVVDNVVDVKGRPGVALVVQSDDGNSRAEFIFDRETSNHLGRRVVQVRDANGVKAGTVLNSIAVDRGIVDRPGETPKAGPTT